MIWRPTNWSTVVRTEAGRAGRSFGLSPPPLRYKPPIEDEPSRTRRLKYSRPSRICPPPSFSSLHLVLLDGVLLAVVEAQGRARGVRLQCRGGGIGRRPGLKIPCPERGVRVRSPPPAPNFSTTLAR